MTALSVRCGAAQTAARTASRVVVAAAACAAAVHVAARDVAARDVAAPVVAACAAVVHVAAHDVAAHVVAACVAAARVAAAGVAAACGVVARVAAACVAVRATRARCSPLLTEADAAAQDRGIDASRTLQRESTSCQYALRPTSGFGTPRSASVRAKLIIAGGSAAFRGLSFFQYEFDTLATV